MRAIHGSFHNGVYIQDRRSGRRETLAEAPAAPPSRHDLDELHNLALAKGLKAEITVLSGPAPGDGDVAPVDVYHRLAADLTENGRKVVADLSGPRLAAVAGVGAFLVKVSHEELRAEHMAPHSTVPELVAAMHTLAAGGCRAVVVSRAAEPALAMFGSQLHEVRLGRMEVADPLGCGDSMTAGIVAGLLRGQDLAGALRLGAAAGAINATRHGLGTGGRQAVERLAKTVELRAIPEQAGQRIRVSRQELAAWLTHH